MRLKYLAFVLAVLAIPSLAEAYPQFQFSTDNAQCTMCHYSPAGGGLINAWGREEATDTISRGGNGEFLNELWEPPEWLQLGGDFRGAGLWHVNESTAKNPVFFPMQGDIYARFQIGKQVTVNITGGIRGSARPRNPPLYSRFGTREHYVMWQPKSKGIYMRAGRFYAPYGLRQVDHTTYIRRDLGFYAWEETYGVSAGYLNADKWDLHVTAHTRDPLLQTGLAGQGVTALFEKRFRDNTAAWGAQAKIQKTPDAQHYWGGGIFKMWFESLDLLLLSEANLGVLDIGVPAADPAMKAVAHVNLTHTITTGWMLGATAEVKHDDLRLRGKDAESAALILQYFPRAHYELFLMGRAERTRQTHDFTSLLMFHYYL